MGVTCKVITDTLFCPDDHFPAPPTLKHHLPSSFVDEFIVANRALFNMTFYFLGIICLSFWYLDMIHLVF